MKNQKIITSLIGIIVLFSIIGIIAPIPEDGGDYYVSSCDGQCGHLCTINYAEYFQDAGLPTDFYIHKGCFVVPDYGNVPEYSTVSAYCSAKQSDDDGYYQYICYGTNKYYNQCPDPDVDLKYYSAGTKLCYNSDFGSGVGTCIFDNEVNYAYFDFIDCPNACSNGACVNSQCTPYYSQVCVGNDLYYKDSCGNRGSLVESCINSCYSDPLGSGTCVGSNVCSPQWNCNDWGACVNSLHTRTCTDANNCGTSTNKPPESETCSLTCIPNWTCTEWTTCLSNQKVRSCTDSKNCNVLTGKPSVSESCSSCTPQWVIGEWSSCSDSVQTRTVTDSKNCNITTNKPIASQQCESEKFNYTWIIIGGILILFIVVFIIKMNSGSSSNSPGL